MRNRILALDLGSSAIKAVLFARDGTPVAQVEEPYPTAATPYGGQEQDPASWWHAAIAACERLPAGLRRAVAAIVPLGTMENLIPLDSGGRPVRPALLYSDARGGAAFAALADALERSGAGGVLGNAPEPLMTAFKLAWLRAAEPEAFARTTLVLPGAKDYLLLRLTGGAATDATTATTVGLMDIARRSWSPALLTIFGIDQELLPPVLPAGAVVGPLQAAAASALGLPEGCPVLNGCGDAGASTLGADSGAPGEVHVYLGSTGWAARSRPLDPAALPRPYYTLAHPADGLAIEIAPILSAGDAASWFGRIAGAELAALDAEASALDAAPPDALFLPYLKGERSPFVDLAVRGALLDLDIAQGRAALYYAVLDGVALALATILDALEGSQRHGAAGRLRLTGGGARSPLWPQLIADATGRGVDCLDLPAATTATGGFRLAAATLGWPAPPVRIAAACDPRPERAERVARRLARFRTATAEARQRAAD